MTRVLSGTRTITLQNGPAVAVVTTEDVKEDEKDKKKSFTESDVTEHATELDQKETYVSS